MTVGACHLRIPVDHATRVGEARRRASELAFEAGLDEVQAGRVALVVTELGTNLLRHAKQGELLIASRAAEGDIEVIALDRGPGIADLPRSLGDGFSTGGTPGTGLGAVRRLADDFDIYSSVPQGTIVLARVASSAKRKAGAFRVGGIAIPAPGESVCGDAWAVDVEGHSARLIVADGLGHGPDAATASTEAVAVFEQERGAGLGALLQSMHERLRTTRGAVVSLFRLDRDGATIRSAGAGNVMARLISGVSDRTLLGQPGTVGVQMRSAQETNVPWPEHALLVVFSDGIESRWQPELITPVLGRDPALAAALLLRDHCRGRDDATVVVVARSH